MRSTIRIVSLVKLPGGNFLLTRWGRIIELIVARSRKRIGLDVRELSRRGKVLAEVEEDVGELVNHGEHE
jgi:hypothetical protein